MQKRLWNELKEYRADPHIPLLKPVSESDLSKWVAVIEGSNEYEGGFFQLSIFVPFKYPIEPPQIKFITRICHPNIHFKTGEICLDLLKTEWTPVWTLQSACIAISALMTSPEPNSPLNCDAANLLRCGDNRGYKSLVGLYTSMYAMKSINEI